MLTRIGLWRIFGAFFVFAIAILALSLNLTRSQSVQAAPSATFPSYNPAFGPPAGWTGTVFQLSQDYPKQLPEHEDLPWEKYDFYKQPREFLLAVQKYVYEGNINRGKDEQGNSLDWIVQKNPVRHWYHMPWRHYGDRGREFTHGMTMEFPASAGMLMTRQKGTYNTYAVAFYNPIAAYTIGQVWPDPSQGPNLNGVIFHDGALIAKLLFTTAIESDVPQVQGAYQWNGYVYQNSPACLHQGCPRVVEPVHLFQMDIAIKDSRAPQTGWVFGTYVYKYDQKDAPSVWEKMVPLGLMWGLDPQLTSADTLARPQESIIFDVGLYEHLGCHGRLTGPLDNPNSACESCHMTAQYPGVYPLPNIKGYACDQSPQNSAYWQDLPGGKVFQLQPKDPTYALDYSMEMAAGVQNYYLGTQQAKLSRDGKTYTLKGHKAVYNVIRRQD